MTRILGTPNEEVWPGVSGLPDYKPTFPQWSRQELARIVPTLDDAGIDLLKVHYFVAVCSVRAHAGRGYKIVPTGYSHTGT